MAQAILDLFPEAVSQFGLLGCGMFTLLGAIAVAAITLAMMPAE